jgi:hypothetical protein
MTHKESQSDPDGRKERRFMFLHAQHENHHHQLKRQKHLNKKPLFINTPSQLDAYLVQ